MAVFFFYHLMENTECHSIPFMSKVAARTARFAIWSLITIDQLLISSAYFSQTESPPPAAHRTLILWKFPIGFSIYLFIFFVVVFFFIFSVLHTKQTICSIRRQAISADFKYTYAQIQTMHKIWANWKITIKITSYSQQNAKMSNSKLAFNLNGEKSKKSAHTVFFHSFWFSMDFVTQTMALLPN